MPWKWFYFPARFGIFIANLDPTAVQVEQGVTSLRGVISSLNANYSGVSDEQANALLSGGWGKKLWVRPPRDIDLIYLLPNEVYHRFQLRIGNCQSALLQEVKGVIGARYPQTAMRGDGQVVIVPFGHVTIEVAPAFIATNGRLLICDTNNGGSYRESDLAAEIDALDFADAWYNGCARPLIRMLKQWQRYCAVPIRSNWSGFCSTFSPTPIVWR